MTRPHRRLLKGKLMIARMPHCQWKTTTFLAGGRVTGSTAPLLVGGAINGAVILA